MNLPWVITFTSSEYLAFLTFRAFIHKRRCLATPCHTQDSICYHVTDATDASHPGGVFTGDTLFIAGCGRFFEGTGPEMIAALDYIGSLPKETIVYNGHEYTAGSLAFGKHIDPSNPGLAKLAEIVKNNKITTGLTTVGDEKEWNVFMRLNSEPVMFVIHPFKLEDMSSHISTEKQLQLLPTLLKALLSIL